MKRLPNDLVETIFRLREQGKDDQTCEVKEAVKKLPESLLPTLSAFSNRDGGTVILGLSENNFFRPATGFDAKRIYSSVVNAGSLLTPPCRFSVEQLPFEGAEIIVLQVPVMSVHERPCYVTSQGVYGGSYIRTGDGDRKLTRYEVDRWMEQRHQPKFDVEPVHEASLEDLNRELLDAIANRCRRQSPRAFLNMSNQEILIRIGALTHTNNGFKPTLGGLLCAGKFPQQFYPRLSVTITVYPGLTKAQDEVTGIRYLDSVTVEGNIPDMMLDSLDFLRKYTSHGAQISGGLRQEVSAYPEIVFREALVNALQHRDYSHDGRGSQVQVNVFADRVEILSPGGLYGAASIENQAPGVSATRNVNLSRLLEHTPYNDASMNGFVIENRGTGLIQIRSSLQKSGNPPAVFHDYISAFSITIPKRKMVEETDDLLSLFSANNYISPTELQRLSGLSRSSIAKKLKSLLEEGAIERLYPKQTPKQKYRKVR